ncbi:50S ribosomal protein L19 [Patescibacteria group bacterium]|nr:50S ribosomal protein L19 [Patescibacteria group bacterium]
MSDEKKKDAVDETQEVPATEEKSEVTEIIPTEETNEPPSEEVTAAAEAAATPKADASIPETVEGEAEVVELPNRDIKTGMWVRVHEKIKDVNSKGEEKERIQVFEGLVIGVKSAQISRTMTVRKNSKGWMVEKIFPLASPNIEKIEVVKQYQTHRAKLNFLRGRFRRKMKEIK